MKTALITGTSSGLGYDIANALLNAGWKVIGVSRTTPAIGHSQYFHWHVDISNKSELLNMFHTLNDVDIDLLINNAAVFTMEPFHINDFSDIDRLIDTNVKGTMYITKLVIPLMAVNSRIIFINSVAGLVELENQSIYCASKYALTAFAGVLGRELRDDRIKVTSIHPGGINTTLWNDACPYPVGDVTQALSTLEITNLIFLILNSEAEYKTVKLFPSIEWH